MGDVLAKPVTPIKPSDQTKFAITALNPVLSEGNTGSTEYTFTVTRTGDAKKAVSVSYGVAGAQEEDFAGAVWPSGTITFGRGETSKTITISVAADTTFETDETFTVALSNPIGGVITTGTATGTIKNDDAAPTYAIAVSGPGAEDGTGALTYTVTRTGPTDVDSTITYTLGGSAEESDYAQNGTGTLTFAAGATTASFMIDPISDTIFEFDETVIATLGTASDGGVITTRSATATISNDDTISRVNVDSNENQIITPGYSDWPPPPTAWTPGGNYTQSISQDGRYVTFFSNSPDLVPGDTNNIRDIFVRDLLLGTTTRVSVNSDEGEANTSGYTAQYSDSFAPSISADGRFVTFFSDANNLVPDDTNSANDVFVRDLQTGTTTRVNVNSDEQQSIQSGSYDPAISADGRFVAFYSGAGDLESPSDTNLTLDVFVRDLLLGTTERVSVSSDETQANNGSWNPAISGDGRFVAFQSAATDLVQGDNQGGGHTDIFVRDLLEGTTERISVEFGRRQS